jgi:hypothetical protein
MGEGITVPLYLRFGTLEGFATGSGSFSVTAFSIHIGNAQLTV